MDGGCAQGAVKVATGAVWWLHTKREGWYRKG